jgi:succinoglycan biosynthesis transport protein ExoP
MARNEEPNPGELGKEIDWLVLLRIARKRWPLVLGVAVAISLAVTFLTLGTKKIYQATATVLFDPNPPRPLGRQVETVVDLGGSYWNNKEYYQTQYELMRSRRLAIVVVEDLGLQNDGAFLANAEPGETPPAANVPVEHAASVLVSRVSVAPVKGSRLASMTYQDADPARAQRIITALAEAYVAKNLEDAQQNASSAVEWLNSQLDNLKSGLDESELALHQYKLQRSILSADIDAQSNMLREEMAQLNTAATTAKIRRQELQARRNQLAKIQADDPAVLPSSELLSSGVLSNLRAKYIETKGVHDALVATGKGENHPDVRAARSAVELNREALLAEIRNIRGAVERDLAAAREQEEGLIGLFGRSKNEALDLNLMAIEYSRLERTRQNSEKLYSVVLERAKEGDLTRMMQINNVRIVDPPLLPGAPVSPNVPRNILMGVLAGLALGIGAGFGREMLDRTVKTQHDVEGVLGLTFLGLLPAITPEGLKKGKYYGYGKRRSKRNTEDAQAVTPDLVVHQAPLSGPAEAARALRTNIQFLSPDKPFKKLLVTSAGPSEGKTTVAVSLAIAMAQADQRVLLVDCDLRRPRVHRVFGKKNDIGLTVALLGDDVLTDSLLPTDIPNLSVLPAGPIPPNPAELLQSDRFARVVADLSERFDRIIFDSPPVVPVTDAAVLATQVDATILVLRAHGTNRDLALQGKRALLGVGGNLVGAVLNAVDLQRREYQQYHYAYYRRGGYYRSEGETKEESL